MRELTPVVSSNPGEITPAHSQQTTLTCSIGANAHHVAGRRDRPCHRHDTQHGSEDFFPDQSFFKAAPVGDGVISVRLPVQSLACWVDSTLLLVEHLLVAEIGPCRKHPWCCSRLPVRMNANECCRCTLVSNACITHEIPVRMAMQCWPSQPKKVIAINIMSSVAVCQNTLLQRP